MSLFLSLILLHPTGIWCVACVGCVCVCVERGINALQKLANAMHNGHTHSLSSDVTDTPV